MNPVGQLVLVLILGCVLCAALLHLMPKGGGDE